MLFSEATDLFLRTKEGEGFSPYTIRGYAIVFRLFIRHAGDIDIKDVNIQILREFAAMRAQHVKTESVRSNVRALKSCLSWLFEEEYIERNIGKKFKEPKGEKRVPKALTVEEVELLRDACATNREHAMVEFFFATGCRVREVYQLNREDINWHSNSTLVHGKGSKDREVYFGARAAIWLKRYLESRKDDHPALFVTAKGEPRRWEVHEMERAFRIIGERCNLAKRMTPHIMRHTFATLILNNGAPLHTVQNLLGHDKPSTTLLYTSVSGTARKQAYDRYFMQ